LHDPFFGTEPENTSSSHVTASCCRVEYETAKAGVPLPAKAAVTASTQACAFADTYARVPLIVALVAAVLQAACWAVSQAVGETLQAPSTPPDWQ
jgi:hypothetical protein